MNRTLIRAVAFGLACLATPALAHHSFSMFDATKDVTITGTVKSFA